MIEENQFTSCVDLENKRAEIIREGRTELSGISTLTTWKLYGAIIMTIIGFAILAFGTYILIKLWLDGGTWSWPLYIFGFLLSALFWGIGLFNWYQAMKLREFEMWAYELYTASSGFGAVSSGARTVSSIAKKDWTGAIMSGTSTAVQGGITAYLLKPENKQKYIEYSNRLNKVKSEMINNQCEIQKFKFVK